MRLSPLPPHMAEEADLRWRREIRRPACPHRHQAASAAPAVARAIAPRAKAGPPPGKRRWPPSPVRPRALRPRWHCFGGPNQGRGRRPAPVAAPTRTPSALRRPRSSRASRPTTGTAASRQSQSPYQPPRQEHLPRRLPRTQKLRPPPPLRVARTMTTRCPSKAMTEAPSPPRPSHPRRSVPSPSRAGSARDPQLLRSKVSSTPQGEGTPRPRRARTRPTPSSRLTAPETSAAS